MYCRLCRREFTSSDREIKSHIIPEFFFRILRKEEGSFFRFETRPGQAPYPLQTGIFEKNILCRDCEEEFSRVETYVSQLLYYRDQSSMTSPEFFYDRIIFKNIDYKKMRLFQLSILWKASITMRSEFSEVKLRACCEEMLRRMILSDNLGDPFCYGCMMFSDPCNHLLLKSIFISPRKIYFNSHVIYVFMFGGYFWCFVEPSDFFIWRSNNLFLQQDGTLTVLVGNNKILNYVVNVASEIIRIGNDDISRYITDAKRKDYEKIIENGNEAIPVRI